MANGRDGKVSIPQGKQLPDGRVSFKEEHVNTKGPVKK